LLTDSRQLAEVRSDGRRLRLVSDTAITGPRLFTSSGLGDDLVEEPRQHLFAELFSQAGNPVARQDALHRHSWPERPHLSVCMRREEACTVSHTVVCVRQDTMTLTYHSDAPDHSAPTVSKTIARTNGAIP